MLTYVSFPDTDGQQLTGKKGSSNHYKKSGEGKNEMRIENMDIHSCISRKLTCQWNNILIDSLHSPLQKTDTITRLTSGEWPFRIFKP